MSFSTVGACTKCGAPIYAPSVWMGVTPPPSSHSCSCFTQLTVTTTTGIDITAASRQELNWPSENEIHSKMKEWSSEGYDSRTFYATVGWLKDRMTKKE